MVVLHDLTLAARFCDRLLLVERGRTLLEGAPLDVLRAPEAGAWKWVLIVGAVIATPIVEEVLFRSLLQSALAAVLPGRWGKWGAVQIASALFTLAHTTGGVEWHSLPAIAVLGLSMAVAYERTGRIAVPIAMHVAFNGANVLLALFIQ